MAWTPAQWPPRTKASSAGCGAKAWPNSALPFVLTSAIYVYPGACCSMMEYPSVGMLVQEGVYVNRKLGVMLKKKSMS
jgi:hypothetical protein